MPAAALSAVFLALFSGLPPLQSQTDEMYEKLINMPGVVDLGGGVLGLPPGLAEEMGIPMHKPSGPVMVSGGSMISGYGELTAKIMVSDPLSFRRPDMEEMKELFTQLKEQYAENPDMDEIHLEIMQENDRLVTTATVNGKTFRLPNDNTAVNAFYLLLGGENLIGFTEGRTAPPVLIHKVEPVYPEKAKEIGLSGDVLLVVTTDAEGEVVAIAVREGHQYLREAVIPAVEQWRYEPSISPEGKQVPAVFGVTVRFLPDGTVSPDARDIVLP